MVMFLAVFFAGLFVALLGAISENAYHAGEVRATGALSMIQSLTQGLIAFEVVAEKSLPNLFANACAWSIGMMVGCHLKRKKVGQK